MFQGHPAAIHIFLLQLADSDIPVMLEVTGWLLPRQAFPSYSIDADQQAHKQLPVGCNRLFMGNEDGLVDGFDEQVGLAGFKKLRYGAAPIGSHYYKSVFPL